VSLTRLILAGVFVSTFVAHALYVGACSASVTSGWADFGISAHAVGPLGLAAYWRGQDYFIGFSYALAAAFVTWALSLSVLFRQGRIVTAEPIRRQSLEFRKTVNGRDDSDLRQLWLLVPFPPSRAGKHLQMYVGPKAQISDRDCDLNRQK
jgi:hypothetical protein